MSVGADTRVGGAWWATRRGTAAIEFGLFAPLMLILLGGVVELGNGVFEAMQVQSAAEAGALYVAKHGWNAAAISAAVINATQTIGIEATPAPTKFCGCPGSGAITVTSCTAICSNGSAVGTYVQINATLANDQILSLSGLVLPTTLTGLAIVRLN
jgi:Flp pilus assembly protein TadG